MGFFSTTDNKVIGRMTKSKGSIVQQLEEEEENDEEGEGSENDESPCICFFCAMEEPNPRRRRAALTAFFSDMPHSDDESHVLVMSGLWSVAMNRPDDPELPSAGVLRCSALLISKALAEPSWLGCHQNIYIPYYAAHILGSYTIRLPSLAQLAISAGAIVPLLSLLGGAMSWIEQRVAVRALGHLASFDETFPAVARHGNELVPLTMRVAATCLHTVYEDFFAAETLQQKRGGKIRRKYQRDLLTRGLGNGEMETRKAEEWASQLQCWSIYLLGCFAWRDAAWHRLICKDEAFLKDLCNMWGGVANGDSPAGVGLMRILCRSEFGRKAVADCANAIESLCNLSRSTDDWQYMGIDCLLLLLDDPAARRRVFPFAAPCLADLVELRKLGKRTELGDAILKSLWPEVKEMCERRRREERMSEEETAARREAASGMKKEGNKRFRAGEVDEAMEKYGEALRLCPLKRKNERMVLHSNRAQCQLLRGDADAAISDATRALSLSTPVNSHDKSLWRRTQAYDMKGMAKESLMDCLTLLNGAWFGAGRGKKKKPSNKVPYCVARMISKQMSRAGLFAGVGARSMESVDSTEFTKEKAAVGSVEFGMGEEEG